MTNDKSTAGLDTQPHLPSAAEEAGAAACRAGVARDAVPSLCSCAGAGRVDRTDCNDLVDSWTRGWDRSRLLQEVSERMFPGSAARPAMMIWNMRRGELPGGVAKT